MKHIIVLFFFLLQLFATVQAEPAMTEWLSQAVVPGEQTRFFIIIPDNNMPRLSPLPRVKGASLRWVNQGNYIRLSGSQGQTAFLLAIDVIADEPGTVQIPSLEISTPQGKTYTTAPQTLHVYPYSAIQWQDARVNGTAMPYGVLWHVENPKPYEHQPTACELKVYAQESILEYGIPNLTSSNIAAWRFEPVLPELLRNAPHCQVLYKGAMWNVITFHSMITPLRAGEDSMTGTISARAVLPVADPLMARFGGQSAITELTVPPLQVHARALPSGAPASFNNAVGNFRIQATTDARDLSANEPITVTVQVTGTGNIHHITCPALQDERNWKLYPPNKLDPHQDERSIHGTVEFQQMMRPVAQTDAVPPFEFSFFNPATGQYKTVRTAPIPLTWKTTLAGTDAVAGGNAAAEPPPAGTIPVAQMTDIYTLFPTELIYAILVPANRGWYFLAFLPATILLGVALIHYIRRVQEQSFAAKERMRAFKHMTAHAMEANPAEFLRNLGNFIESHIPVAEQTQDIRDILAMRNERAFTPAQETEELPRSTRSHMLHVVKRVIAKLPALMIGLLLCGMLTSPALATEQTPQQAAVAFYNQGEYSAALEQFDKMLQNPEIDAAERAYAYYGMGNAHYRLNQPGTAALYYRRALAIAPHMTEAECNLQFIERKEGAILPLPTTEYDWLTYMDYATLWPIAIVACGAMTSFLALLLVMHRHKGLIIVLASVCGLFAAAAIGNLVFYPESPQSTAPQDLLVVTQRTSGRSAADPHGAVVITLPAATPLTLKAKRGSWYYAQTFQKTPVWIPVSTAQPLE